MKYEHDDDLQDRRWALIEMGIIDVQSQPEEILAVGIDPVTYELHTGDAAPQRDV